VEILVAQLPVDVAIDPGLKRREVAVIGRPPHGERQVRVEHARNDRRRNRQRRPEGHPPRGGARWHAPGRGPLGAGSPASGGGPSSAVAQYGHFTFLPACSALALTFRLHPGHGREMVGDVSGGGFLSAPRRRATSRTPAMDSPTTATTIAAAAS